MAVHTRNRHGQALCMGEYLEWGGRRLSIADRGATAMLTNDDLCDESAATHTIWPNDVLPTSETMATNE